MTLIYFVPGSFALESPCDTAFVEVVDGNFNGYFITGNYFDEIHSELTRNLSCYYMLVGKLNFKGSIGCLKMKKNFSKTC